MLLLGSSMMQIFLSDWKCLMLIIAGPLVSVVWLWLLLSCVRVAFWLVEVA